MLHSTPQTENPRKPNGEDKLRHLWLELTRKCNLQCVHCYASAGPHVPLSETLTTLDWIKVLHEARNEGCKSVQFIGGEPLLHPDLELLLRTARSLGYDAVEVFTNGTLLTPKWLTIFAELQVSLALSFYATSPEIHDSITGRKGSYYRTLRAIDLALARGLPVRVGIIQVTQPDDEVKRLEEFLKARGVSHVGVDRVRKIGRADHDGSHAAPLAQLQELCGACHNGNLCVTATGECYPCIMARAWPVGNIRNGVSHVLRSQQLAAFRQQQREFLANKQTASCWPGERKPYDCMPDCNPNCLPHCNPNCSPYACGPYCSPNCSPFKEEPPVPRLSVHE